MGAFGLPHRTNPQRYSRRGSRAGVSRSRLKAPTNATFTSRQLRLFSSRETRSCGAAAQAWVRHVRCPGIHVATDPMRISLEGNVCPPPKPFWTARLLCCKPARGPTVMQLPARITMWLRRSCQLRHEHWQKMQIVPRHRESQALQRLGCLTD